MGVVVEFSVGVEEEYQLVDEATGALRSHARDVLAWDWSDEIRPEIQATTIEIGTKVCGSAAALERELKRLRLQAGTAAAAQGLAIAAAGTHPFSRWEGHALVPGERYERIRQRYQVLALDEHNFGMHVHVAVPDRLDRVQLMNVVREYLPHLLALACSSPFYEGLDTGYDSYRMVLWRRWPQSGMPPRLANRAEYRRLVELLLAASAIEDERNVYWSIRPHPKYPTLEFRATDVCPRLGDAVAIAALIRALVFAAAEGVLKERRWAGFSWSARHAILSGNEWRAARYGLDAVQVDPTREGGSAPMRDAIRRLIDEVIRSAEALGDAWAVAALATILEQGNGSDRMRREHQERGGFAGLMEWLVAETMLGSGIDRRRVSRV